jgi:protein involved in polysaccharide export with SLBB domain
MKRIMLPLLIAIAAPWSPSLAQRSLDALALDSLSMAPGDVARITVWRHPELTGDFIVGADGTIIHPLFRTLHVAGVSFARVETDLRQYLTQFDAEPAFTLTPLLRVFVVGQVKEPNSLTVPAGTTVAQAIALAGGPTLDADLPNIRVVRGTEVMSLDLTRPDLAVARMTLRSGDQIVVPRSRSLLREVIAPWATLIGGAAAITNIVVNITKR